MSPPGLAARQRMNSRSDRRLRYFTARMLVVSGSASTTAERQGQAERGVGLLGVGVRGDPRVRLGDPGEIAQPGRPVVAGLGVDAGQVHGHGPQRTDRLPAGRQRRLTLNRLRTGAGVPTMAGVELIRISGGSRLAGEVRVGGAKNSALKLMAAALLAPGRTVITNVPRITDMLIMAEVLRRLG